MSLAKNRRKVHFSKLTTVEKIRFCYHDDEWNILTSKPGVEDRIISAGTQILQDYPEIERVMFYQKLRRDRIADWLLEENNNFCALPYLHMAIESNGVVKPCCYGSPIPDKDGVPININNSTIGEAFNHPDRQLWIDEFDKNEKSKLCHRCWKDNVKQVNRVKFSLQRWAIAETERTMYTGKKPDRKLQWLEIKPGNRCNLKCRICGVHNSSQWTKESWERDNRLGGFHHKDVKTETFKDSEEFQYTQSCEWTDQEQIWNNINSMDHIRVLHIMGGEPFMVPEHFDLLKSLIDAPSIDTSEITIRYNTNGTKFPSEEEIELWKNYKTVVMQLSIDDIGERFEYARNLGIWKEVENNLINFKKLEKEMSLELFIDCTVSIYNIWYLAEFEDEMFRLGYSLCGDASHFVMDHYNDIRFLSDAVKEKIVQKYNKPSPWKKTALEYLQGNLPSNTNEKRLTIMRTNLAKDIGVIDGIRKESFMKVYPEWWNVLVENSDGFSDNYTFGNTINVRKENEQKNI